MKKITLIVLAALLLAAPGFAARIEKRIESPPGGLLEVDLESGGSISVSGWAESAVLVEGEISGSDADGPAVEIEKTGNGVRIEIEPAEGWGRRRHSGSADLRIKVPAVFDLDLETMGGDIAVENVNGDLEGETMGGDLRLTGLKGKIDFETMGGDIELTDSDVDGDLETMGGEVLLENVSGDVDGSSMGGNVIYKNVTRRSGESTGEAVIISTMGGEIEIGDAPSGARLNTMGGDIDVGSASKFVEAETMGGDITIGAIDGRVNAETMGGNVVVTVVGDAQGAGRDIELASMGGEIHLTVPRNFSMDVEIEIGYDPDDSRAPRIISDAPLETETEEVGRGFWRGAGATLRGTGSFDGGKNKVKIETVGGDVHLKYAG